MAGKTFEVTYPPVLEEDLNNPRKYHSIVTLKFSEDNTVSNPVDDTKGTYVLNEDMLVINFENKNEKLNINFIDFKKSDLDVSSYSAVVSDSELDIDDSNQVKKFLDLSNELSEDTPVELIEK